MNLINQTIVTGLTALMTVTGPINYTNVISPKRKIALTVSKMTILKCIA